MKARQETGPAAVGEGSRGSDRRVSSGDGGYSLDRETGGLAALLVATIGLALGLLYWSARAQDDILIRDSRHLADTALGIQATTLENILTDYSYWDEAYANISENFNLDWFYQTFGDYPYLTDYFGIASSFIIAPGNRIVAYTLNGERGEDVQRPDLDRAAGFLALIEAARRKVDGEFQEISAFVRVNGQLNIAAARMVLPYSQARRAQVDVTAQNGMVAVVLRPVDDAFLAALSADFGFTDLGYAPPNAANPRELSVRLAAIDGETLGFLTWRIALPSSRIFAVVLPALLAVVAVIGLLALHLLRIIRRGQQGLFAAMLEARAASRAKSEFLATMSHELRTPLNGVIGIVEILRRSELTDDQRMLLGHLAASADDQLALVNNLLDMGRIEAGGLAMSDEAFDPAAIVRAAVTLLRPKADEKGLAMRLALPDGEDAGVIGDPGCFKQVVLNLVSNAVKFTEKGEVAVALTRSGVGDLQELVLTVADTGIGISREDQQRIFDRFTQVDNSIRRKAQGSGLGLAICKALVDAMHGSIELTSALGEGTRVSVSLKLRRAGSAAETTAAVA